MLKNGYQTYPNLLGHPRGDENRGGLRVGVVIENNDTKLAGISGFPAMVTHEFEGWVRFYTFGLDPDSRFPDSPIWRGPFTGLSEEIEEIE